MPCLSMKFKTGLIFAGDQELAPLLSILTDYSVSQKAMLTFYSGKIEGIEIVTLYCGVCKTNAAIATQILIDIFGCNIIINAGTAGGIDSDIHLFDTVIATESAYWDVSEEILTEFHPWMKTVFFKSDAELLDQARRAVSSGGFEHVYFGRIITGETFIEEKHRFEITKTFAPLCVDMETAGIAHVCYVNEIPFISVRTITDTAERLGVDEFELNCDKASQKSVAIVKTMLRERQE